VYDEQSGNHIPQPDRIVTVLEVSPFEADHNALRSIFSHSNWKLLITRTCAEAAAFLKKRLVPVVLCERELPDGTWKDILERASRALNPPAVIVSARLADDRLWAEVLNLGGYNVLSKPFKDTEVFRDVGLAWLHWKNRAERMGQARERPKVLRGIA
jgi:DNA-binding response OmpR family regulator